jgi:hypothetical protein
MAVEPKNVRVEFRLSERQRDMLVEIERHTGLAPSAFLRAAIHETHAKHVPSRPKRGER